MSCSLCRLPFTPCSTSIDPHPPPPGTLTAMQYKYLMNSVGIGKMVPGAMTPFEYLDNNMFGGVTAISMVLNIQWEADGGTIVMLHKVCSTILRHIFDATEDTKETLVKLSQIELVLGRPQDGDTAGRLNDVNYEGVGKDKVDLRPFWIPRRGLGTNEFDWPKFMASGLEWTLSKLDVFPKFTSTVAPARLAAVGPVPESTTDIITTQSIDVLHALLPYLSTESFVLLLSTCRLLRRHALTTFQPHARERVLALGWAVPLAEEYASVAAARAKSGRGAAPMAHATDSPVAGDWLLYLSHVHRTQSMRARRWVWALATEVRRAHDARLPQTAYADTVGVDGAPAKTKARRELERVMGDSEMYGVHLLFTGKLPKERMYEILRQAFAGRR